MKYLGKITDNKDLVTKEYVDGAYTSKAAASGGTDVSLCTTGEKYTWNNKSSLALGETSSTAYRGDRGKTAYTHATDANRLTTATASGLYKIAATAHGHVQSLTAVEKADITALGIPGSDTTYSAMTATEATTGTETGVRVISPKILADFVNGQIANAITAAIGGAY